MTTQRRNEMRKSMRDEMQQDETRNEISGGSFHGPAFQAGSIGSVHIGTGAKPHGPPPDRLTQVKRRLAEEVRRQWQDEARAQELRSPTPLRLWWRGTERAVAAPGAGGPRRGDLDGLVAMFRELPVKQLVILGERAPARPSP
ncbi:hypothetical protein GCM10020221_18160 [Streptomyces thioluteus]|uniref:Uncharacterized protein n=2 Tax=Streptomyces thioluteus TaxID=66431 RepID=A0ABN3WNL6_STRTU